MSSNESPHNEPRVLTLTEAFKLMRVGRTKGFELLAENKIPGVIAFGGRCKRVRASVLRQWLENEEGPDT